MKYLLLFISLSFAAICMAQSGSVYYLRTTHLNLKDDKDMPEFLKQILPEKMEDKCVLHYTGDETFFENIIDKNEEAKEIKKNGMTMIITHDESDHEIFYANLKTNEILQQKYFKGRRFLITDELKKRKWRITGNQKKVLGKVAMEATITPDGKDTATITAWYTPEIPFAVGPQNIMGLPGLILEVYIGGRIALIATKIVDKSSAKISRPTKGKKLSRIAFEKMVKEKNEEDKKLYGDKKNNILIIEK